MSFPAPAVRLVVPVINTACVSVIAPAVVNTRLPLIVEVPPLPNVNAPMSFNVTLLPDTTRNSPPKLLALSSVMSFPAPAVSVLVPPTERVVPVAWVKPEPVAIRFPVILLPPNCKVVLSTMVRLSSCPLRALKETVEPNTLLKSPRMMLWFAAAAKLAAPAEVITPLCVIPALVEVADKLVLAVTVPRSSAVLFRITTRVPAALTEPTKLFSALFRITAPTGVPVTNPFAVAKNEAAPGAVITFALLNW